MRICRRLQGKRLPSGTLTPTTAHPGSHRESGHREHGAPRRHCRACRRISRESVLEAVRWPCAIRASPGVSRPNPLREDRGRRSTAAGAFSTTTAPLLPADQQRGNGNRATVNHDQTGTMHSPDIRNARCLNARPAAASQIVSQGESRTVMNSGRRIECCVPAPVFAMMPQLCHACIRAIQPGHALTSWLPNDQSIVLAECDPHNAETRSAEQSRITISA